ncbi:MAG: hypothetical protein ACRDST_20595 [Pseudonocardiaceae bacterium]
MQQLAGIKWVTQRVFIEHLAGFSDDQAYWGDGPPARRPGKIASEVFGSVAHLLKLDLDIVIVDTTSTDWEIEAALTSWSRPWPATPATTRPPAGRVRVAAVRAFQDHRRDLPQVVIAMAVTRDGIPIPYLPR